MPSDPQVEEIRSRLDIVEIVGAQVRLRKSGKDWKGVCPFHTEKTPSFYVSPDLQRFHCYGCGKSGDIFTFVQETEHLTFPQALERLAERAGVTLQKHAGGQRQETDPVWTALNEAQVFFREQLAKSHQALEFLEKRGVSKESADRFGLGFAPGFGDALATALKRRGVKLADAGRAGLADRDASGGYGDKFRGRVMFPVRDIRGRIIAFGGRAFGDIQPKYLNSPDTELFKKRQVLYAFDLAKESISSDNRAILVEGYLDVIACHAAGLTNAVAALGTALSEDHATLFKRWCETVVIAFDGDEAGIKAALRSAPILNDAGLDVRIARLPEGDDPDTLIKSDGPAHMRRLADAAVPPTEFELDLLETRHDTGNPAGATAFINAALPVLASVRSEVDRDRYLERVAKFLPSFRMDRARAEQAVRLEVNRLIPRGRGGAAGPRQTGPVARPAGAGEKAELAILRGACDTAWSGVAWPLLDPEMFADPGRQAVVRALLASFPEGPVGGSAADILSHIEDAEASATLTAILMTEEEPLSEQFLLGAGACLKERQAKQQRMQVARLLTDKTAKSDPAWQEYCKLLGEGTDH